MGASAQLKCHPQGVWRRGGDFCAVPKPASNLLTRTRKKTWTGKLDLLILRPGSIFPDLTSPHDLVAVFRFLGKCFYLALCVRATGDFHT